MSPTVPPRLRPATPPLWQPATGLSRPDTSPGAAPARYGVVSRPRRATAALTLALALAVLAGVGGAVAAPARSDSARSAPASSAAPADSLQPILGRQVRPSWAVMPPENTSTVFPKVAHVKVYPTLKGGKKGLLLPDTKHQLIQLKNPTPQGFPLTMVGFGEAKGYLYVLLPVHPNQTFGWVKSSDVRTVKNGYRLEISQQHHRLLVWRGKSVIDSFAVAVGRPSLPTPNGYFFANQILKQANPAGDYGPYIVSTSGFSEVLTSFEDGDAAVGLHGTNQPYVIGTDASHGCIRMFNRDVAVVARTVSVGTLFEIHP